MIEKAVQALKRGDFILLYDFDEREGETDLAIRSDAVTPRHIMQMRKDAGGLICTAVHPAAAERLGLPFASDLLNGTSFGEKTGDIPYDRKNRSSFSLWVNHRTTYTGITDNDRALTITAIANQVKLALNGGGHNFGGEFRSPGHVPLLRAADSLLDQRRGQTELSIALAELAGITPSITICEMLDDENGKALSKEDAIAYAKAHNLVFIEGNEVLGFWASQKEH
ncbi:MAG: 3,4-dihydroxy-2-butanone-4-phosphate synthase [Methanomicrobiaceae archaeon]|nr:3,4-dihydroxy-2-butanone-4-phosphate synthase [Methanomicrobiaceae archaeon]